MLHQPDQQLVWRPHAAHVWDHNHTACVNTSIHNTAAPRWLHAERSGARPADAPVKTSQSSKSLHHSHVFLHIVTLVTIKVYRSNMQNTISRKRLNVVRHVIRRMWGGSRQSQHCQKVTASQLANMQSHANTRRDRVSAHLLAG